METQRKIAFEEELTIGQKGKKHIKEESDKQPKNIKKLIETECYICPCESDK